MDEQNHYERLGVSENASFEEIQQAKQRLSQQYRDDTKILEGIEAAYDAIIMDRLKMRKEGKIKVPERIRFAEKLTETPPAPPSNPINTSPPWLQRSLDTPSRNDLLLSAGIFFALAGMSVFSQSQDISLLALLMSLGSFANVYLLNRKEQRLGRSILITFIGLLLGIGLGTVLVNLLGTSSNIVTLSVEQLACLVTFVLFWLSSSFLR